MFWEDDVADFRRDFKRLLLSTLSWVNCLLTASDLRTAAYAAVGTGILKGNGPDVKFFGVASGRCSYWYTQLTFCLSLGLAPWGSMTGLLPWTHMLLMFCFIGVTVETFLWLLFLFEALSTDSGVAECFISMRMKFGWDATR